VPADQRDAAAGDDRRAGAAGARRHAAGEIERQVTLATLEYFGRHKEKTAATLGVSLKTLYNRLKEYSTVPERGGANATWGSATARPDQPVRLLTDTSTVIPR
jgi:DNA-binding NtrC family response regulator